mmetsp:Transcript_56787/g.138196  ORF Transcript_56787/g.138196 Transcript_56787/m.138196 type:complete len:379 (-) Transcript_56787:35-1171(-)|eukprot:CAMPEP_0113483164 /NCGR_PEP_ID=MMETSP0014_2-20120614/23293_1 /TAXON_ID=2857 /ORGANISM="Nitzschia sp." /LENGTH=378 /DNA_ID=CAMNT_0000376703 /DNA_START=255 /DNA_END=1391 /DNA_ORIENTATION=+ /assembly_acc=CAM_ASM_000159
MKIQQHRQCHHHHRCLNGSNGRRSLRKSLVYVAVSWLAASSFSSTSSSQKNPAAAAGAFTVVEASSSSSTEAIATALKNIDFRYFVAGGTCAAFSHGITTPIDVIKTKIQADPKKYNKGMIDAATQICQDKENGGALQLTQGLGPTLLGYGVEGAMKFGVYEIAKPIFTAMLATYAGSGDGDASSNQGLVFVLSSFIAGAVAALLLVPMESLRIKQVTDPNYKKDNIMTGIPKIIQQDGFGSMMSGVWAMLAKQVPYTFGKQVSFDVVAGVLYGLLAGKDGTGSPNKWVVSIGSAACASLVACLLSQPGDMVLTETYKSGDKPGKITKVVSDIASQGPGEFFRGTQARIVHVGLIITSQLVVYDIVKQMLGLPATGSH